MDKAKTQDQVQAIYLAQANIFAYEARKSAKSWVPLCDSTVPISILYDNTRSIYRIISVDADIKEVVVNTTVIPELDFVKTTQKFGYWKDVASGRVFGIGFASEYEAEAFDECLRKVKQNIGPPSVNSSIALNSTSEGGEDGNNNKMEGGGHPRYTDSFQGQGDGPVKGGQGMGVAVASRGSGQQAPKPLNWNDFEQIGPTVLSMMNSTRTHGIMASTASRPSTYKVDLPIIRNSALPPVVPPHLGGNPSVSSPVVDPKLYSNIEDQIRIAATPPPGYHLPFQYMPQASRPPNSVMDGPILSTPTHHGSLIPLNLSLPPAYCYQGPHQSPTCSSLSDALDKTTTLVDSNGHPDQSRRDLAEEISRVRSDNTKLTESLIESTCTAKKWELQVNSLREDNIQLLKTITELNSKVEGLTKEGRELKEQASRWKEHYQQAVSSAKEKSQHLKDAEDKLKSASVDKARIESVMKDLEEELKRQQALTKEAATSHVGQYTNKYFKELEEHYRKLLTDSQKRIEEVLRKDNDRKNVLRGADTLFTGAIQGLINIHAQIRQAYEQ